MAIPSFSSTTPVRSGVYRAEAPPLGGGPARRWTLHLDLDGSDPGVRISLVLPFADGSTAHLVAELVAQADGSWTAAPVDAPLRGLRLAPDLARIELDHEGDLLSLDLVREQAAFRRLGVEVDLESGVDWPLELATAVEIDGVARDRLGLPEVFAAAGLELSLLGGGSRVLETEHDGPGDYDAAWDDVELHDAMLASWQRPADDPWFAWLFLASLHEDGRDLAGLMFDGPASPDAPQRQGCAGFRDAWLHRAVTGGGTSLGVPAEEAPRNRFFTLVHELGHCLNLAHSFEKGLLPPEIEGAGAWMPTESEPDAASFMNYPSEVPGFWERFAWRFTADELRFLRHAPESAVVMGGSPFFVDHALAASRGAVSVEIGGATDFGPTEPVHLAIRLRNQGPRSYVIGTRRGIPRDALLLLVKGPEGWRALRPFQRAIRVGGRGLLRPGQSRAAAVYVGAEPGTGGVFRTPGRYEVQVALVDAGGVVAVSAPAAIHVREPASKAEEAAAAALQSDRVARLYAFGGSNVLLEEEAVRGAITGVKALAKGRDLAALHADLVWTGGGARPRRVLRSDGTRRWFELEPGRPAEALAAVRAFLAARDGIELNAPLYSRAVEEAATILVENDDLAGALDVARSGVRETAAAAADLAEDLEQLVRRIAGFRDRKVQFRGRRRFAKER